MRRQPVKLSSRFWALFLGLCLSLPAPAQALRVQNGGLEERTPTIRTIENALRSEKSASSAQTTAGLEETEQERQKIEEALRNLARPEWGVVSAAQETLTTFAQNDKTRQALIAAGLAPSALGFPQGATWDAIARLGQVTLELASQASNRELSLGGRGLLRRKLVKTMESLDQNGLRELGRRWQDHAARLEKLDRAGGLASFGAELHFPIEPGQDIRQIQWLAVQLASGAGSHAMVPWILEGNGRQIDLRLLPAYPGTFRPFLAEALGDPALKNTSTVGAHYSVGVDLGKELVPVALALYYGDENYLEAPQPGSAESGVGFPGVWTYRGQSLDLTTGQVTNTNQSNLHLRPLRTFIGKISLDLFQTEVDQLAWLASAAAAPKNDPRQVVYQAFLGQWEQWVRRQGGEHLWQTVQAAEQEVASKTGAGVSPALDKASVDLLAAMYRTPEKGAAARQELAGILKKTLEQLEVIAWGSARAAQAVRAYRESDGLADLDRTLSAAIQTVQKEIFSTDTERGSPRETQLLNVLTALDPIQAQPVRATLNAGLEEKGSALGTVRRTAILDQVQAYLRDLTRSGAMVQVLDPEMLEQYPELAPLATLSELSDSILIDRGEATLERLRAQNAQWVDYYGLPINADRFSQEAGSVTVIPHTPGEESFVQFLTGLLQRMAPLKPATQAEVEHLAAQLLQLAA